MTLLASFCTAVTVYLGVGLLSGWLPRFRLGKTSKRYSHRHQAWLVQAGTSLTVGRFVLGSTASGVLAFVLSSMVTQAWWLGIAPAIAATTIPTALLSRKRAKRLQQLHQAWPDALREVLASVSAGSTLVVALGDLADGAPAPLRPAFGRFRLLSRMMGVLPALEMIREELADAPSDRVIEVLGLAYEHGGGLATRVLRDLVDEMTEDLRLEAEVRSDSTEQRIESRVVVIIPWALLLFLTVSSAEYRAYYQSPSGLIVVLGAVVWSLMGVVLMRFIGRSVTEQRVLLRPGRGFDSGQTG